MSAKISASQVTMVWLWRWFGSHNTHSEVYLCQVIGQSIIHTTRKSRITFMHIGKEEELKG